MVVKNEKCWFIKNEIGPERARENSNGLRLWENDATGLGIMFLISIWPPGAQQISKFLVRVMLG